MTEPRVLVLLDTSPASEAALESAARLARHHQLELTALFVEDQDLIATSGHVFAREVSMLSGEARPFDREVLLARLARQRKQIEMRLSALDQRERLRWRLEVVTGPVVESIRQAALEAEWVVLGKAGWSASRGATLGSTARRLVENTRSRLLLWDTQAPPPEAAIVALTEGHPEDETVIETARQLALATDRTLRILLLPSGAPSPLPALTEGAAASKPPLRIESLPGPGLESLRRALQTRPAAAVVVDDRAAAALGMDMADLIAWLDTPVIRVPGPSSES